MRLQPESEHPHGLSDREFDSLFTHDRPIVFAYHGYPWLIHRLTYRRANHANLHVRGYKEEGTTTTPFDMVMLNDLDRFHLVVDVDRPRARARASARRGCGRRCSTAACAAAPGRASTARITPTSATGSGPSRRQRGLDEPEAARRRGRRVPAGHVLGQTQDMSAAVAHRVVHGGARFREPVVIDDDGSRRDRGARGARAAAQRAGAARDRRGAARAARTSRTSRSSTRRSTRRFPTRRRRTPCRSEWRDWGVRRYGFHGLSVQWAAERVRCRAARRLPPRRRQLGDGRARRTVGRHDDGLQPARGRADDDALRLDRSRSAPLPAARARPRRRHARPRAELRVGIEGARGRLGRHARDRAERRLALDVFAYRVAAAVAAMAAALDGLDALVFTGGHRRALAARARTHLRATRRFSASSSTRRERAGRAGLHDLAGAVAVHVVRAREELVAARAAREVLG